jgi:hypothetical protein
MSVISAPGRERTDQFLDESKTPHIQFSDSVLLRGVDEPRNKFAEIRFPEWAKLFVWPPLSSPPLSSVEQISKLTSASGSNFDSGRLELLYRKIKAWVTLLFRPVAH